MSGSQIFFAALAVIVVSLFVFTRFQAARLEARFAPKGAFVDVAGGRLHVTRMAPIGSARAGVLLIHGASGNQADMMAPLGAPLASRGFDVFAIDRPGHGWSDRLDGETPDRQASLIRAAANKLGLERAIVVAHSLAGMTATNLALDHKDFVAGLALVAPVTHPWPGREISWYYNVATTPVAGALFNNLLAMPIGLAIRDLTLDAIFRPQTPPADYAERTGVTLVLRPEQFQANARDVAGAYDFVSMQAPRLKAITAPTAIVTGNADGIVLTQVHSYGSARDIPGASLRVLDGVGHSPHWAATEAVIETIEEVARKAGL